MRPQKLKWVVFEIGLLLVSLIILVSRAFVGVDFEITRDGYTLSLFTFALGMLVRELFIE